MVYGSSTELSVELFGPQTTEVLNGERPEMQNIVPWESIALFHKNHPGTQKSQLYSRPQSTRTCAYDQTLNTQQNSHVKQRSSEDNSLMQCIAGDPVLVPWCWCKRGLSCTLSGWLFCPVWPIVLWPSSSAVCSSGCGRTAADPRDAASALHTAPGRPWGSLYTCQPAQRRRTGHVPDTSQTVRPTCPLLKTRTGVSSPPERTRHGASEKEKLFTELQGDLGQTGKRWMWKRE